MPRPSKTLKAAPEKGSIRHQSLAGLSKLLARDRNTIGKWVSQFGCPVMQEADRAAGREWAFDVAEVVRWREEYCARTAVEAAGPETREPAEDHDPAVIGYDEARRREKVAQATMAEIGLDERLGEVVLISDVVDLVTQEYAVLRSALQSLGGTVAPRLVGLTNPAEIQSVIDDSVIDALGALTRDKHYRTPIPREPEAPEG